MPTKKRFLELYFERPMCAITGHAFDPVSDHPQLLPSCVRIDMSKGYTEGNITFVVRMLANSMRNQHATFDDCKSGWKAMQAAKL